MKKACVLAMFVSALGFFLARGAFTKTARPAHNTTPGPDTILPGIASWLGIAIPPGIASSPRITIPPGATNSPNTEKTTTKKSFSLQVDLVAVPDTEYMQYESIIGIGIMDWAKKNADKQQKRHWRVVIRPFGWGKLRIEIFCRNATAGARASANAARQKIIPAALIMRSCENPLNGIIFVIEYIKTCGHLGRIKQYKQPDDHLPAAKASVQTDAFKNGEIFWLSHPRRGLSPQ